MEVLELILGVVLKVVHMDHVVLGWLWLVLISVLGAHSGTGEVHEVLGVLVRQASHCHLSSSCLVESHHLASHQSSCQHGSFKNQN